MRLSLLVELDAHANSYNFSSSGTRLVSRRYTKFMYSPAQMHFLIDCNTCIERMGSGCLPGTVDTGKAFTKGSGDG